MTPWDKEKIFIAYLIRKFPQKSSSVVSVIIAHCFLPALFIINNNYKHPVGCE